MIGIALIPVQCVPFETSALQIWFKLFGYVHKTTYFCTILLPCHLVVILFIAHHCLVVQTVFVQ